MMMFQLSKRYLLLATACWFSCVSICWGAKSLEVILNENERLDKLCSEIQNIRTLSQMKELIDSVDVIMRQINYLDYQKLVAPGWARYFKLGLHPARQCLEQADAILDLAPIIKEKDNVCQASHISKLVAYNDKHLKKVKNGDEVKYREDFSPLTEEFFSIYLNQVAYECKQNLLPALLEADKQVGGVERYAKVLPWIINNNNNNNNLGCTLDDAVLDAAADDYDYDVLGLTGGGKSASNARDRRCEAIKALSSIKKINELVQALEDGDLQQRQLDKVVVGKDSISATSGTGGETNSNRADSSQFILVVPEHKYGAVEEMMRTCSLFERVYTHTVMPIVRLSSLGVNLSLDHSNKAFDRLCLNEELIQRWFSITLICKPLLSSRLTSEPAVSGKGADSADGNGLVVVVDKPPSQLMNQQHNADSSNHASASLVEPPAYLSYPIEDDLWIGKHQPSKLANMKSKFITRALRTFKINKLFNSVVWRKSARGEKKVSISLILVILALIGVDGTFFSRR